MYIQGPQSQTRLFNFEFMRSKIKISYNVRPFSEPLLKHNFGESTYDSINRLQVLAFVKILFYKLY